MELELPVGGQRPGPLSIQGRQSRGNRLIPFACKGIQPKECVSGGKGFGRKKRKNKKKKKKRPGALAKGEFIGPVFELTKVPRFFVNNKKKEGKKDC